MASKKSVYKKPKDERAEQRQKAEKIKAKINRQRAYFRSNYERFDEFYQFTHQTTLTAEDRDALEALEKPVLEYNIINAMVSRLCGEYSKQEPQLYASAINGQQVDPRTVQVVEGYFRHMLVETNKKNGQYLVYRDQLSGGMSCWKIYTDYRSPRSFAQDIILDRVYHPTLCGFDPLAQDQTKKDAEWYYELFPMQLSVFQQKFPDVDISELHFGSASSSAWTYRQDGEKIIVVCDFYEKKYETVTIVELADGQVLTKEDYKKMVEEWDRFEQVPVKTNERVTTDGYFCRVRLIENQIIEEVDTDFTEPNLVFVDGDSSPEKQNAGTGDIMGAGSEIKQFIKPYVFHAKDHQRMVNLAGQTIANYMENLVQHKFMIAQESLPDQREFQAAYKNVQKADVLVYKGFIEAGENQEVMQMPPPQPVQEIPLTPVASDVFNNAIVMLQNILGSYDASLGIQNNELSGVAIVEAATQSNAAAMPYIVSNLNSLNQVGKVVLGLIPKIHKTPTTVPIRIQGEKHAQYIMVNGNGGPSLQYDADALGIEVNAGPSFAIARSRAFNQITTLMKVNPVFAQFINEEGMDILLDNLEFYGIDLVRDKANAFMEKLKQQQAQQQQMAMQEQQNNPQVVAAQAAQLNAQANMVKAQTERLQIQSDAQQSKMTNAVKIMQIEEDRKKNQADIVIELIKAQADKRESRSNLEIAVIDALRKSRDQEHKEIKDIIELNQQLSDSSFNQSMALKTLNNAS